MGDSTFTVTLPDEAREPLESMAKHTGQSLAELVAILTTIGFGVVIDDYAAIAGIIQQQRRAIALGKVAQALGVELKWEEES